MSFYLIYPTFYSKLDIQRSQVAEEERRKTVQYETEMGKRRAEY